MLTIPPNTLLMYSDFEPYDLDFNYAEPAPINSLQSLLGGLSNSDNSQILQSLSHLHLELIALDEVSCENLTLQKFTHGLIACLQKIGSEDILLLSMQCMCALINISPDASRLLISEGVICSLAEKLDFIDFLDIPECAIRTLSMLSIDNNQAILKDPAFQMIINLMDFCELSCQREIAAIAENAVRGIGELSVYKQSFCPFVPAFLHRLNVASDPLLLEKLLSVFASTIETLPRLCSGGALIQEIDYLSSLGLMKQTAVLIDAAPQLYEGLCRLVSGLCLYSPSVCVVFFSLRGMEILQLGLERLSLEALKILLAVLSPVGSVGKQDIFEEHPEYLQIIASILVRKADQILQQDILLQYLALEALARVLSSCEIFEQDLSELSITLMQLLNSSDPMIIKAVLRLISIFYERCDCATRFHRQGLTASVGDLDIKQLQKKSTKSALEELSSNRKLNLPKEIKNLRKTVLAQHKKLFKPASLNESLNLETITAFEFIQSRMALQIWKDLIERPEETMSGRIDQLTQLCVSCIHILGDSRTELPSSHTKVRFFYEPQGHIPLKLKDECFKLHNLFTSIGTFSLSLPGNCFLDDLADHLIGARSKDDLKNWQRVQNINRPKRLSELRICLFVNDGPIPNGSYLADYPKCGRISFRFGCRADEVYARSDLDYFAGILGECSQVGLDPQMSVYPYLRLLKFFSLYWNKPIRLFSQSLSISMQSCRFMFPFQTRLKHFYKLTALKQSVRRHRSKIIIDRKHLWASAIIIFSDLKLIRSSTLEFEFKEEIGTGVGPTLEFYSLISNYIRNLNIWRETQETGLFPLPLALSGRQVLNTFTLLGAIVAKAIVDRRPLDLPFSTLWWKLVLKQTMRLEDTEEFLGKSLSSLRHCDPDDLGLYMTFIGNESLPLVEEGESTPVSYQNLEEFLHLNAEMMLMQREQAAAFQQGFERIFPVSKLSVLELSEIESVVCGEKNPDWNLEELSRWVVPNHGYGVDSVTFRNLLIVMSQFDLEERKNFLQFISGSSRLPLGGFKNLNPRLTVVRKDAENSQNCLPSVMTCQNYLKIPDYSSLEVLEQKVKFAIAEGRLSFHLS